MKLLIAIPALNEEGSIASIVERCLAARSQIVENSQVTDVEITVISDGSTDRTVELASQFKPQIHLIVFEKNRGYGAAIKEAWSQSDAELVAFLDADGTCDPNFFVPLCRTLIDENACVVLGCRLHGGSEMPLIRRIGNMLFASLLFVLGSTKVRDSASGMRVVRQDCLDRLMPLPNGLDFTPAMSARCLLSSGLPIRELDMPYRERVGRSKLSVIRDGLRFLGIIVRTALLYRPSRAMGLLALMMAVVASALMMEPALYYLQHRSVAEWMIYRFVVAQLLGAAAVTLFCTALLARRIVRLTLSGSEPTQSFFDSVSTWMESRFFWPAPLLLLALGGALVYRSYLEMVQTGATYEHWSRFIVMAFFVETALLLIITRAVGFVLNLLGDRLAYMSSMVRLEKKTTSA
jgi:glycosyltransferase involved in cell wall biosynthesis